LTSHDLPEPQLSVEEKHAFEKGVREFNAGYFFECHDTLEELWSSVRGPSRDFFQGLIQVSVGFYHLTSGNPAGAESMFGRALKRFAEYPERYWGFDLAAHRAEIGSWLARIRAGESDPPPLTELPKWTLLSAPPSP